MSVDGLLQLGGDLCMFTFKMDVLGTEVEDFRRFFPDQNPCGEHGEPSRPPGIDLCNNFGGRFAWQR
jgi:hypothetical protein